MILENQETLKLKPVELPPVHLCLFFTAIKFYFQHLIRDVILFLHNRFGESSVQFNSPVVWDPWFLKCSR